MTRSASSVILGVGLGLTSALVLADSQQAQQPIFRAATDLVFVDAAVRENGRMVQGLGPADFELKDNGVKQRIEAVEATAVPIDLTLIVDTSGDPFRSVVDRADPTKATARVNAEVRRIAGLLRPDDRIRAIAFGTYVRQILPAQAPGAPVAVAAPEVDGLSSMYNALVASLLQPVAPTRRHIIIARTKGEDTVSAIDARAVRDVAIRSDAQLHLVMMEGEGDDDRNRYAEQCKNAGVCQPVRRFWIPPRRMSITPGELSHFITPLGQILAEAADSSGGGFYRTEVLSVPSLEGTFKKAFDDFRNSYVLRYTPQNVKREGWHDVEVTVPGRKGAVVRARPGYAVDTPPADTGAASVDPKPTPKLPTDGEADPARIIRDFVAGGNPWPATPRREAAFVVDLATAGFDSPRADSRTAARALLENHARLVRNPLEPDEFERYWLWAAIALIEGSVQPETAAPFIDRAIARFPSEPRFKLARAIVTDQRHRVATAAPPGDIGSTSAQSTAAVDEVSARYREAMNDSETAAEARVRLAFMLHRVGRYNDALPLLDDTSLEISSDSSIRYLRQLFRGHVLDSLGRLGEAVAAYRSALAIQPEAQSARVALMSALVRHGDREEANALAERIQTAPVSALDPWWVYWLGDRRFLPGITTKVRSLVQ